MAKFDAAGTQQWLRNYLPYSSITRLERRLCGCASIRPAAWSRPAARSASRRLRLRRGEVRRRRQLAVVAAVQRPARYARRPGRRGGRAQRRRGRGRGHREPIHQGDGNTDRRTTLFIVDGVQTTLPQHDHRAERHRPAVRGERVGARQGRLPGRQRARRRRRRPQLRHCARERRRRMHARRTRSPAARPSAATFSSDAPTLFSQQPEQRLRTL